MICANRSCLNKPRKKGRYCNKHHAEYMRGWRLKEKKKRDMLAKKVERIKALIKV